MGQSRRDAGDETTQGLRDGESAVTKLKAAQRAIIEWMRLRLSSPQPSNNAPYRVPRSAVSWGYVFGSAIFVALLLELVTGLCLALVYAPSADNAWQSLLYLNYQQPLGWYLRALPYWGSHF